MNKGINTTIEETKKELVTLINSKLNVLPISIVSLIVESVMMELRSGVDNALQQEAKSYAKQQEAESEQIEWVDKIESVPCAE